MTFLAKLVQTILSHKATCARLQAGEPILIGRSVSALAPLSDSALDMRRLGKILMEVAPASELARLRDNHPVEFDIQGAPTPARAEVVQRGAQITLTITIEDRARSAAPPEAADPAPPIERDVTPAPSARPPHYTPVSGPSSVIAHAGAARIDALLRVMAREDCSDLHLTSGNPPLYRKDGDIEHLDQMPVHDAEQVRALLYEIMPVANRAQFESVHDTDFAYEIEGVGRFRVNAFMDRLGPGGVFRIIPSQILTAEQLNLPQPVLDLCWLTKGLVVVTGPTGSGKSTTLAAMIDLINRQRATHIITIEDPIEFVHPTKRALINQREIGVHTKSFKAALRAALREDPDIVLVGEMRDLETIEIAMETAETGHLVFGTLHTNTAPSTVDRIIDQFSADRQSQVRTMLSESLKAVIAQDAVQKTGRRARRRARDPDGHSRHLQPDPRGQDLPDPLDHVHSQKRWHGQPQRLAHPARQGGHHLPRGGLHQGRGQVEHPIGDRARGAAPLVVAARWARARSCDETGPPEGSGAIVCRFLIVM